MLILKGVFRIDEAMPRWLTPLPEPPRRVRGLLAGGGQAWFGRIFTLPHAMVGIGSLGYLVLTSLWILFGMDIDGVVTDAETSYSRKGGRSYTVHYEYKIGSVIKSGSDGVNLATYERLSVREDHRKPNVVVRYFSLGPFSHAEIETGGSYLSSIWPFLLWVAGWNTFVGFIVYMLWIKPIRVRQLYKRGLVAAGTLIDKRVRKSRGTTLYVSYSFRHPATGEVISSEITVWDAMAWGAASRGQPVTVLYAPDNPGRNTAYEFGGYTVDLEPGVASV